MPKQTHLVVLTGPAAAALYDLDGFRQRLWPHRYTVHHHARIGENTVRTRASFEPHFFGETPVAPMWLVLRHLNSVPEDLLRCDDNISPRDRVELAAEHARRLGVKIRTGNGGADSGNAMLREVKRLSRGEPPTESFAETRALQQFRNWEITPWRQVPISIGGSDYRMDFVVPFRNTRRPTLFRPNHGLIVEIDSKEFHEGKFEEDRARWAALDRAGFHWISVTPTFLEKSPSKALAQIEGAFRRAGHAPPNPTQHPTRRIVAPNSHKRAG